MSNLQEAANRQQQLVQQRLLLGLPIAAGGLLAVAVTAVFTVPQWLGLQSNSAKLQQLEALQQQIPLLRAQLAKSSADQEQAERKQRQVLQLIEGSGEFATFLAQLDQEATRTGVRLEMFEPVTIAPAAAPAPARGGNQPAAAPPPPKEPLQAAGLTAQRVLLTARGNYPSVLSFMRSVEKLNLLVVASNFSLELVELPQPAAISSAAPADESSGTTGQTATPPQKLMIPELKLALTYYQIPEGGLKPVAPPTQDKPADAPDNSGASS
jgi:type IV pilus assembly protein PilO